MVETVVEVARQAKLEPVGLDLVPFALLRSVSDADGSLFDQSGEVAVIDVGAEITSICVHEQGVPRFVRILPTGGHDITSAVSRALGVPAEEAEALKVGQFVDSQVDHDEARRVVHGRASSFVDEIRSSLEFYAAQTPGARVGRVVVTGGGARLEGFLDMLQERLVVPVEQGHPFEKVEPRKGLAKDSEAFLAVAVGLAIPGGEA